jgi:hydroxymethylpyrimidine pyrophosphatase-like HAD family hydrolase
LAYLTDHYGLKRENVITFGDNVNDIEMIKWAGIGVAMGNADERLKEVADIVTEDNTNAGIAKTLQCLLQL